MAWNEECNKLLGLNALLWWVCQLHPHAEISFLYATRKLKAAKILLILSSLFLEYFLSKFTSIKYNQTLMFYLDLVFWLFINYSTITQCYEDKRLENVREIPVNLLLWGLIFSSKIIYFIRSWAKWTENLFMRFHCNKLFSVKFYIC